MLVDRGGGGSSSALVGGGGELLSALVVDRHCRLWGGGDGLWWWAVITIGGGCWWSVVGSRQHWWVLIAIGWGPVSPFVGGGSGPLFLFVLLHGVVILWGCCWAPLLASLVVFIIPHHHRHPSLLSLTTGLCHRHASFACHVAVTDVAPGIDVG